MIHSLVENLEPLDHVQSTGGPRYMRFFYLRFYVRLKRGFLRNVPPNL
jgi:hypothetical protein